MKKYLLFLLIPVVLSGCMVVNYSPQKSDHEIQLNLTQITDKNDNVAKPLIFRFDELYWYAPTTIDVSSDEQKILYIKDAGMFRDLCIIDRALNKDSAIIVLMNVYDMHFGDNDTVVYFAGAESATKLQPIKANQTENYHGGGMVDKMIINDDSGNEYISYSGIKRFHKYPNLSIYKSIIGSSESSKIIDTNDLDFGIDFDNDSIFYFSTGIYNDFSTFSVNSNTKEVQELFSGMAGNVDTENAVIYFTKINKENNRSEIYVYDMNSTETRLLLSDPEIGFSTPQISNDGTKLLLVGATPVIDERQMNLDLYIYNIESKRLKQLTYHIGNDLSPCWSSDDSSVFFLSQRGNFLGKYNIWKLQF